MTKKEAIIIAQNHLDEMNNKLSNNKHSSLRGTIKWVLDTPKEIKDAFYFDYKFELIKDVDDDDFCVLGGPGYLIKKSTKEVVDLAWWEYSELSWQIEPFKVILDRFKYYFQSVIWWFKS